MVHSEWWSLDFLPLPIFLLGKKLASKPTSTSIQERGRLNAWWTYILYMDTFHWVRRGGVLETPWSYMTNDGCFYKVFCLGGKSGWSERKMQVPRDFLATRVFLGTFSSLATSHLSSHMSKVLVIIWHLLIKSNIILYIHMEKRAVFLPKKTPFC